MHENGFAEIDEMSLKRLERFKYGCKDRLNFEIDTLEAPPDGKAARIMSVSPTYDNFEYAPAPCSYRVSIIPITDYLNQGSPSNQAPGKQNSWVTGIYTLSLRYMNEGSETVSKTFSFTIGANVPLSEAAKINNQPTESSA